MVVKPNLGLCNCGVRRVANRHELLANLAEFPENETGMIFNKQDMLFVIGHAMRRKGYQPTGWLALARLNCRQNKLMALYPPSN